MISNVGSFGEGVVKIGLTRRLDPLERVRELGDASVPFRFDVHAKIFDADADAVSLETRLHQHLANRRVNRVNLRRELGVAVVGDDHAVGLVAGSNALSNASSTAMLSHATSHH